MANINQSTHKKTELTNRALWFDGDVTVNSIDMLLSTIEQGVPVEKIFVRKMTPELEQYNKFVPKKEQLSIKQECNPLNIEWNIPTEYKELDVEEYLMEKIGVELVDMNPLEQRDRVHRTLEELKLYIHLDLIDVLKTIIYIINTLRCSNIVWGVGRGSSVSSYILYLVGVHDVDSVLYELDVTDFL